MDRRKSLKTLALSGLGTSMLFDACKPADKPADVNLTYKATPTTFAYDRMEEEKKHYQDVIDETFFTPEEMTSITTLGDIIIPEDAVSRNASSAGVPEFIEFIVKDMPYHQTPMRGGLRWLNLHSIKLYGKDFNSISQEQRIAIVDSIAYPAKAEPGLAQGVAFFNLIRNLTVTGFYTSAIGIKDLGYVGNAPNQWNGVPADVLAQYKLAYTEKELKECISFNNNG